MEKSKANIELKLFDETSLGLRIADLQFENIGNYTCVATNVAGFDSYTLPLSFEGPPKWKNLPQGAADVLLGNELILPCEATGYPLPIIKWTRQSSDGSIDPIQNDVRKRIMGNGTFVIRDVVDSDSGQYICEVNNGVGEKLSAVVHLRVHEPPVIISEFQTITSKKGDLTRLKCRAKGEIPIFWDWRKGDQHIGASPVDRFETSEEQKAGFVSSELVVRDTKTEDAGIFECKAKNKFGETSGTVQLTVLEPPEPPMDVKVTEAGSRLSRLSWRPPYSGNSPVVNYIIRYWTNEGKGRRLQEAHVQIDTAWVLKDLHPGVRYHVVVLAENSVGAGNPSAIVDFLTTEEEPVGPPTDVAIRVVDSTCLKVSWKPPPKNTWNGRLTSYQIGFRKHGTELAYRFENVRVRDTKTPDISLLGLDASTRYDVIVRAINGAGMGPWSPEMTAVTSGGNPPSPPLLKVTSATSHSLQLEWDVPGLAKPDFVKQFLLEYGRAGKMNQKVHIPGSKRKLLLRGLDSNVRYELRMSSYNEHGLSVFSPVASDSTVELHHEAMTEDSEATPFYLRLYFIVPVAVSVTVVVSTLVVAWACVARTRALEAASHLLREPIYEYKTPIPQQCPIDASTLREHRQPTLEEAYDLPWDMTLGADGNYTRLQNGDGRRSYREDHNRRSR